MRKTITAIMVGAAVLATGVVEAKEKTIAGNWTLTTENLSLILVLAQNGRTVTGTLDYPHGAQSRWLADWHDQRPLRRNERQP